jgi:hypothetical protein
LVDDVSRRFILSKTAGLAMTVDARPINYWRGKANGRGGL